jgi:hypothetical protein
MDTKDEIIQQLRDQIAFLTSPQIMSDHLNVRDHFAMAALSAMLSPGQDITERAPSIVAKYAYVFADAMMEERKRGNE